ncbi:MAG: ABC-F family ATP-binding cassette domain-containing protein [Methylobacteriaceae bacterium]|nr:ABC-F family ATP-binding cassette domain-containing protein [Methylobacteriaceae bacterium]
MLLVRDLTYRIGDRVLFDKSGFVLPDGAKAGLVGRNGSGKTTLLRLIAGELTAESGDVVIPKDTRIGYVSQEAPNGPETLLDTVLAADTTRARLIAEAEGADGLRRAEIETELADIGAYSAPARAAAVLHGLGFNREAQLRPCSSFSGGWRMRVALASVLFAEPDFLLLDEPTNYLDLEGSMWLNDYLGRYPHTVLVISHDREFLDANVDHIVHLEQARLTVYRGGYTSFAGQYALQKDVLQRTRAKQEAERKHLQSFVDRFRYKASKARQAQSRLKRLEKLEPVSLIVSEGTLPFHLSGPERLSAPPLLTLENVAAGYDGKAVLSGLTLTVQPDDRIALLGANGNGKSTFCKLIGGRLPALSGALRFPQKMKTAYFAQHQIDELTGAATPYEHVARRMPGAPVARIRARAAQFGFSGARAETPIDSLSGGEKARLLMGLAAFDGPDLLILDEPTNHLDIDSRSALMEAVNDYRGAVVLVSHDRFLIEACAERLWLVAGGRITNFDGDIDDYRALVLKGDDDNDSAGRTAAKPENRDGTAPERVNAAKQRAVLADLRKQRDVCEERMQRLTDAVEKIDATLADGSAFRKDAALAGELARKRAEAAATLHDLENRWLELATRIDEMTPKNG